MEEIKSYKVNFKFDSSYKKLQSLQKSQANFSKFQERSLKRQKDLLEAMSKIKPPKSPTIPSPTSPNQPKTGGGGVGGRGDPNAHLKAREKHLRQLQRAEESRITRLNTAVEALNRDRIMIGKVKDVYEGVTRENIKQRVAQAKTAQEVRQIVAEEKKRLIQARAQSKEYEKQNFLLRRMKSSSEQIAGNMVSAFAAVGLTTGITQIGQNFESIDNTMLAVSKDAVDSAKNLQFVRDEAYRLGLTLGDTAKNYAKMVAAQGEMSDQDVQQTFLGVTEMSTLLGLSADETGRAMTALTQIMSKNQVMSEELSY